MIINNERRKWGRRAWTGGLWGAISLFLLLAQKPFGLDISLVVLFIEKSAWVASFVVVGLTGTDIADRYVKIKTNQTFKDNAAKED